MTKSEVTEDQFELDGDTVCHKPTNAYFHAYPNEAEFHSYDVGGLGSVLPDGRDFREHEVKATANSILAKRLL